MQNFIELSAGVNELSCIRGKNLQSVATAQKLKVTIPVGLQIFNQWRSDGGGADGAVARCGTCHKGGTLRC